MLLNQRRTANLGVCAAGVVMVSSLGVLIASGFDTNAPATSDQKTVESAPPPTQHDVPAGYSVSLNVRRLDGTRRP